LAIKSGVGPLFTAINDQPNASHESHGVDSWPGKQKTTNKLTINNIQTTADKNINGMAADFATAIGLILFLFMAKSRSMLKPTQASKCSPPGYHICQKALNPEGTAKQEQHQQKQRVREHSNFYKNKNYKNTRTVQPKTNMKKQIDSNTTKPK